MLVSPHAEYVSYRASKRDHSASPSCRSSFHHQTPPRSLNMSHDAPMLTPSPLKHLLADEPMDLDDDFFQSPPRPATYVHRTRKGRDTRQSARVLSDDENEDDMQDELFLVPSSSWGSLSGQHMPSTSPFSLHTPLRTPAKQVLHTLERDVLSVKDLNTQPSSPVFILGSKRKPTPLASTPLRVRAMTPLTVASVEKLNDSGVAFDRLAPLSAPRFVLRTPQSKAETELHLKHQAETMTMLTIKDLDRSDDETGYDSGHDILPEELVLGGAVASRTSAKEKPEVVKLAGLDMSHGRGLVKDAEVIEAVSPGGHITKRRARSRPVSAELLGSKQASLSPFGEKDKDTVISISKSTSSINFPSATTMRTRRTPPTSASSEAGSPVLKLRIPPVAIPRSRTQSQSGNRMPLNRLTSISSATLFFGPAIPSPKPQANDKGSSKADISVSHDEMDVDPRIRRQSRPSPHHRHSYAGYGGHSSPRKRHGVENQDDDDVDIFFGSDTSFSFNVNAGTPSPKKKQKRDPVVIEPLPRKFRPRDSGVVLCESSDDDTMLGGKAACEHHHYPHFCAMPRASTSVSTVGSESEEPLVTPSFGPSAMSGWPATRRFSLDDDDSDASGVDAFIRRTLMAGGSKSTQGRNEGEPRRAPGTPVKKVKTSHIIGATRPWQSAVANKIGFPEFDEEGAEAKGGNGRGKGKGKPRKSLPAAFPNIGKDNGKLELEDSEDEEVSPSVRKELRYEGLGLGRPAARPRTDEKGKTHWLIRRSSSGAFSSGSESTSTTATPTRHAPRGTTSWHMPPPKSPLKNMVDASGKSSMSTSSTPIPLIPFTRQATARERYQHLGSQTLPRRIAPSQLPTPASISTSSKRPAIPLFSPPRNSLLGLDEEHPGRFLRDFVEVDELGSGEFGKAMKVRYKDVDRGEAVFAVKKSKRFEGVRHRQRLREEVDILKLLSEAAGPDGHPNILGYVDSWEEDETLYIQTELCELGNFAHFLWEYGRAFVKLDEARVWKIFAELSAGLQFMHDAGVIHLDLKPANIFVNALGRFKIGDFGMASVWPRPPSATGTVFEREGDKLYLAPEVLQGRYSKAADMFSLGMTMLETATNIIVPDQGDAWHRLRREDFSQVPLDTLSAPLAELLRSTMRAEPALRLSARVVCSHSVVARARCVMESGWEEGRGFAASALGEGGERVLAAILDGR